MANREIEAKLIMSAVDKTGKAFRSVSGRLGDVNRQAEAYNKQARANSQTAVAVARTATVAAGAVAAVGAAAYRNFADDERMLSRIGNTAEATREEMAAVRGALFSMAKDTGLMFNDAVSGLDALTASGRTLDEAMSMLPSVLATAQASGSSIESIATSADALSTAFNISGGEMQSAFDILVAGGKAGKFELKDMAQHLPSLAPTFRALGYEGEAGLRKLIVALQTVRTQTGQSGEAATAFRDVLIKMESQPVANNFKRFGVDLRKELENARKNGDDILDTFIRISQEAVKGDLSKLPQLFTDTQMLNGMRALVTSSEAMERFGVALKNTDGATLKDLGNIIDDNRAKIDKMTNSADRFFSNFGGVIADPVGDAFDAASDKIEFTEALKKGLEDEDMSWLRKKATLMYPDKNDSWIIEQAKQGGYQYDTFEGGKREGKTQKVDGTDFFAPDDLSIPIPQFAPVGGRATVSDGGVRVPSPRGVLDTRSAQIESLAAAPLALSPADVARQRNWMAAEDLAFAQTPAGMPSIAPSMSGQEAARQGSMTQSVDLEANLKTERADASLTEFKTSASQPMEMTLDLDTSAAEAKLNNIRKQASQINQQIGSGRNRGRSMPEAGL